MCFVSSRFPNSCFFSFRYRCPEEYVGEYCQFANPCHSAPGPRCQNGGTCNVLLSADTEPQFQCTCPLGYEASLCEISIRNACESLPCLNSGTCRLRTLENYTCVCATGYRGEWRHLVDVLKTFRRDCFFSIV